MAKKRKGGNIIKEHAQIIFTRSPLRYCRTAPNSDRKSSRSCCSPPRPNARRPWSLDRTLCRSNTGTWCRLSQLKQIHWVRYRFWLLVDTRKRGAVCARLSMEKIKNTFADKLLITLKQWSRQRAKSTELRSYLRRPYGFFRNEYQCVDTTRKTKKNYCDFYLQYF